MEFFHYNDNCLSSDLLYGLYNYAIDYSIPYQIFQAVCVFLHQSRAEKKSALLIRLRRFLLYLQFYKALYYNNELYYLTGILLHLSAVVFIPHSSIVNAFFHIVLSKCQIYIFSSDMFEMTLSLSESTVEPYAVPFTVR